MKKIFFVAVLALIASIVVSVLTFVPSEQIVNSVTYRGQMARWITPASSWEINPIQLGCALALPWIAIALYGPKGNARFVVK